VARRAMLVLVLVCKAPRDKNEAAGQDTAGWCLAMFAVLRDMRVARHAMLVLVLVCKAPRDKNEAAGQDTVGWLHLLVRRASREYQSMIKCEKCENGWKPLD
jgi:hypothetical protein